LIYLKNNTTILLTSLFAWWGLANNMTDTLLAAFKRIMSMSDARAVLIQVVCYGAVASRKDLHAT